MIQKYTSLLLCATAFAIQSASPALAQSWPTKPIRLVVPFAAGGSTDATARVLADNLRVPLGQPVIIDNKPGAGANIGAEAVAKAAPDGYTFLMATSTLATNPALYKSLSYDVIKDFAPVSETAVIPNVLVVQESSPIKNLKEFIAYIKDPKNTVNYGSAGNGSASHLSGALLNSMAHGNMTHVPYKGGAPANTDLIAGQIQAVFAPLVEVLPFIKSGKLRALAVTTKKRTSLLPDVPAVGEVLPGYEVELWNGILAPAKTPPDIVNKMHQAIVTVLAKPEMRARLADVGSEPVGSSPEEFKKFIASEVDKWGALVKLSGAKVD